MTTYEQILAKLLCRETSPLYKGLKTYGSEGGFDFAPEDIISLLEQGSYPQGEESTVEAIQFLDSQLEVWVRVLQSGRDFLANCIKAIEESDRALARLGRMTARPEPEDG